MLFKKKFLMSLLVVALAAAVVVFTGCSDDEPDDPPPPPPTYTLTVNVTPAGGGTVTVGGAAYTAPTSHVSGASVTVAATAAAGYTFTGWTGASTAATPSVSVTISGATTLTANFKADETEPDGPRTLADSKGPLTVTNLESLEGEYVFYMAVIARGGNDGLSGQKYLIGAAGYDHAAGSVTGAKVEGGYADLDLWVYNHVAATTGDNPAPAKLVVEKFTGSHRTFPGVIYALGATATHTVEVNYLHIDNLEKVPSTKYRFAFVKGTDDLPGNTSGAGTAADRISNRIQYFNGIPVHAFVEGRTNVDGIQTGGNITSGSAARVYVSAREFHAPITIPTGPGFHFYNIDLHAHVANPAAPAYGFVYTGYSAAIAAEHGREAGAVVGGTYYEAQGVFGGAQVSANGLVTLPLHYATYKPVDEQPMANDTARVSGVNSIIGSVEPFGNGNLPGQAGVNFYLSAKPIFISDDNPDWKIGIDGAIGWLNVATYGLQHGHAHPVPRLVPYVNGRCVNSGEILNIHVD